MPNTYKRFQVGEPVPSFPGNTWNRLVEAARWVDEQRAKQTNQDTSRADPQTLTVMVRNAEPEAIQFQAPIMGIDTSTVKISDDESVTRQQVTADGKKPSEEDHRSAFAVLQGPVGVNDREVGIVAGYTWAEVVVNEPGDRLCGLKSQDGRYLHTGRTGAEIIYAEKEEEEEEEDRKGPQWCFIKLLPLPPLYWLEDCKDESNGVLVSNDLARFMNKIVMVDGACYKVKAPPLEVNCWSAQCVTIQTFFEDCEECESNCWKLTPCSTGSVWYTRSSFGQYNGRVIRWSDDLCYKVTASTSCEGAITANPNDVKALFSDCAYCDDCTELISCADPEDKRYIRTDQVGTFPDLMLGKIIKLDGICYTVNDIEFTCPTDPEDLGGIYNGNIWDNCEDCGCHLFHRCSPNQGVKVVSKAIKWGTNDPYDLDSLWVGQAVTFGPESLPTCWEYKGTYYDCDEAEEVEIVQTYEDCDCCGGWKLTECTPEAFTHYTQVDLCQYYDENSPSGIVGDQVIKGVNINLFPEGKCFQQLEQIWQFEGDPQTWLDFAFEGLYPDCPQCKNPKYKLVDAGCKKGGCEKYCGGCGDYNTDCESLPSRITDEDLHTALDQIIKYDGSCWEVKETTDSVTDPAPIDWAGPFASCEPCLAEPICIEVVTDVLIESGQLKQRKKRYVVSATFCESVEENIVPVGSCP